MTRATLSGIVAVALGTCLALAPRLAVAAKPCKDQCKADIQTCRTNIANLVTACVTGADTDKVARKACKKFGKKAKRACKKGSTDTNLPQGCDAAQEPCSPSGAFLDGSSF